MTAGDLDFPSEHASLLLSLLSFSIITLPLCSRPHTHTTKTMVLHLLHVSPTVQYV